MQRNKYLVPLALLLALTPLARADDSLEKLRTQFRAYALSPATDRGDRLLDDVVLPTVPAADAPRLLAAQRPDGTWPDIDYKANARSSWEPFAHLARTFALTLHAARPNTPPAESAQCLAAIHKALAFWTKNDFKCPNWWYNDIGVPKITGMTALLLGNNLTLDERNFIANTILPRSKIGAMTGQNREWLAGNALMRGLLLDDPKTVAAAAEVIWDEVRLSTGEGIQPDNSFHQHGAQQQFGNYGMAFAVEAARWSTVLQNSPYAIPPEKLSIVRNYLLDGQNWISFKGKMDISSLGRQIQPDTDQKKAAVISRAMQLMEKVDPDHAPQYAAFTRRNQPDAPNDLTGNRFFYRSDYLVHRTPNLMTSLKMWSTRVIGGETVNSENLSGLFLADGATFFYRTANEYSETFPAWDWHNIPGTTELQSAAPVRWPAANQLPKGAAFVGAASDGTSAAAAMDFRRPPLSAKKAWFFHNDLIVCLGTDITSSSPDPVATTLNQSRLQGDVRIHLPNAPTDTLFTPATQAPLKPDYILHDGLRYLLPTAPEISLTTAPRTGNWKAIFDTPAAPTENVIAPLFTLSLNHGSSPKSATYAYAVLLESAPYQNRLELLANTPDLQSVRIDNSWQAAILWKPATLQTNAGPLTLSDPCIVLIDKNNKISLADPTHILKQITLTQNNTPHTIPLPTGPNAGATVQVP